MKKLVLALFAVLLVGCASSEVMVPTESKVCPRENSFLCDRATELGVSLEDAYGWIYSSAAIAAVSDVVKIKEVCDFEKLIADWYVREYPLSYDGVILEVLKQTNLIKEPEKAMLIKNILNQRFKLFQNPSLISEADDEIIRMGHVQFRRDMLCY